MAREKRDAAFGDETEVGRREERLSTHEVDGDAAVVLHEERPVVGTEKARASAVRIRTKVITEEKTVTVPLRREVLEIIELDDDPDQLKGVGGLRKPREITLHEERVAVETVAYERVRITREKTRGEVAIDTELRREVLDVDEVRAADDLRGTGEFRDDRRR